MALLERAIFYQALLHTLVIMGAAENQSERPQLQETSARIAVACPETGDADQPLYPPAFHSAHQKRVASDIQGGELAPNARGRTRRALRASTATMCRDESLRTNTPFAEDLFHETSGAGL